MEPRRFTRVIAYVSTHVDKNVLIWEERRHAGNRVPTYKIVTVAISTWQNSLRNDYTIDKRYREGGNVQQKKRIHFLSACICN